MSRKMIGLLCGAAMSSSLLSQESGVETVVARGPHSDVHQIVEEVVDDSGQTNLVSRQWEVLQSGLNFWSEADQAWVPSTRTIELAETGAIFKNGPIRIRFAANQNDINGSIEFTLPFPDQRVIKMQTIGIALTDGDNSVWIGEVQDSNGLLDGNTIIYPNAFSGIKADVQVRIEDAGQFHNDVVLREAIDPALLQALQMDPARCRLEIWHQILQCPQGILHPGFIKRADGSVDLDEQLEFSESSPFTSFYIGPGAAFLIGTNKAPISNANGKIPVAKARFDDPQTTFSFLIESIPYTDAQPVLQTLPAHEQALNRDIIRRELERSTQTASHSGRAKPTRLSSITTRPGSKRGNRQIAAIMRKPHESKAGFVMDYTVVPTIASYRFNGVTTYYVTNSVTLSGTTTIEKGAVVKFATNGSPVINVTGAVDCQTALGMPAIFTGRDDDSVGEVISGSSGSPNGTYGVYNLLFTGSSLDIHDIHTRFAQTGLGFQGTNITLANIQAIRCNLAVESCNNTMTVRNLLAHNSTTVFGGTNTTINAEHVTAHVATQLFTYSGTGALNMTNSLIIGVTNNGAGVTTAFSATSLDDSTIFQTVKAGAHYLADGSPYRNAGTATLSSPMLAILAKTTTYPPVELTGTISTALTLGPQAQRDTDVPDLGAHFVPIDYLWGGLTIGNTTLTLTNGVAVALYGTSGTVCNSGAKIVSEGKPQTLNQIFRYQAVQEQPTLYGGTAANMSLFATTAPSTKPQLTMRFTKLFMPANTEAKRALLSYVSTTDFGDTTCRDSEWYNIYQTWDLVSGTLNVNLNNNILSRCHVVFNRYMYSHQLWVTFYNNYTTRTDVSLGYQTTTTSPPTWIFRDNLFDTGSISGYGSYPLVLCDHNGYYSTSVPGFSGGSDQTAIYALDFVSGSLGPYYYPTSGTGGLAQLIDTGSRSAGASAGLYHYTVRTDQTKEGSTTVDIGYHYIATDTNGPIDSDSDGIPDYIEDSNSNGVPDSTESNYAINVKILSPSRAASLP